MGVKGVRALLEATPLLEEIHADENNYQDGPARFIASSTTLKTLRSASLEVADVGAFVRSAAAASLETLRIERGAIDEGTAHALAALPRLESLSLYVTAVDEPARPILRARFGPYLSAWAGVSLDALNAFPGPA